MEDMLEQANEVMETMGRSYGLPEDVDEDDLEAGMYMSCCAGAGTCGESGERAVGYFLCCRVRSPGR